MILVDDSNPSAVTLTATTALSAANDSTTTSGDGILLLGLFTSNIGSSPFGPALSDGLQPVLSGDLYNTWSGDHHSSASYLDLGIYDNVGSTTQTFSTSSQAFTGSMTIDLSSVGFALPAAGASGNILAGWSGHTGGELGTYLVVVPEPSVAAPAAGLALIGYAAWRRRGAAERARRAA